MRLFVDRLAGFPAAEEGKCPLCGPAAARPLDLEAIPARQRRGLSMHQRMTLDALSRLTTPAERPTMTVVHGSALAELETAVFLSTSTEPSPARFTASVHSSPIGTASIAFRNHRGHVSLSAGPDTIAMCLLEAAGRLHDGDAEVVVVVADETSARLPDANDAPFALGLRLTRAAAEGRRALRLVPTRGVRSPETGLRAFAGSIHHALRCEAGETLLAPIHAGNPSILVEPGSLA